MNPTVKKYFQKEAIDSEISLSEYVNNYINSISIKPDFYYPSERDFILIEKYLENVKRDYSCNLTEENNKFLAAQAKKYLRSTNEQFALYTYISYIKLNNL